MARRADNRFRALLIVLLALVTLAHLWVAAVLGLTPDEAYYWQWSRSLSLVYADHPPLIAWLVRLGTELVGLNSLGIRLASALLGTGATALVYGLARECKMWPGSAVITALVATLLPISSAGALLATPDMALAFSWLAAIYSLIRLARGGTHAHWYVIGLAFSFGLLAKHEALLIILLVAFASMSVPQIRKNWRTHHPFSALALAIAILFPYFLAEYLSPNSSFSFQLSHLTGQLTPAAKPSATRLAENLSALFLGQIGLLSPLIAWWVLRTVQRAQSPGERILKAGFFIPLAVTALACFWTHPEQNWAAIGHPAAAVLACKFLTSNSGNLTLRGKKGIWFIATFVFVSGSAVLLHIHALKPFLPLPAERDPVSRLYGWTGLLELEQFFEYADTVVCDNYGLRAMVAYQFTRARGATPNVTSADRPGLPSPGTWLLLDQYDDWGHARLTPNCSRLQPLPTITLRRDDGRPVRHIFTALGIDCTALRE